uniref:DUF6570 domain-containing protein n=1 Tax=Mycena chlorophos TaxID=658473 RepID=A0ABQ0KXW3_MYCCL|nr:predicted protein [Mycena chlorophos]
MANEVQMSNITRGDPITVGPGRRDPVTRELLQTLARFTVPEIIKLLVPYSKPSKSTKRKRDALLEFAARLPIMAQVIILVSAEHAPGKKRKATQDVSEPRPAKRCRRIAQPNHAAPTLPPTPPEDNAEARDALPSVSELCPQSDARVHRGTVQDLINGPFLAQVDASIIEACIGRCIDHTGNQALKKSTCVCCARRLFLPELEEIQLSDIPNKHLLKPTHPHPAHQLLEGVLLHEPAIKQGPPFFLRSTCRGLLVIHERPPLSLANNMWIGPVPFVLNILTLPERLLVALYFPAAYVVKLFPKKAGGKKWDKEKINSGMRGNVSTYRLNTKDIADMIEGTLMPRPVGVLAAIVAVTFVGAKNVPLLLLSDIFEVRRQRVADALSWLKANNPFYARIEISDERLNALPTSGIPDEILFVRYAPDESILDREHAGYVPVDLGDDLDVHEDPQEDVGELPEVADGEEREIDEDHAERRALLPVEEDSGTAEAAEHWEPAVFPLQAHGTVDVGGDSISQEQLFASAVRRIQPTTERRADYGIRPGSEFVSEYPREVNGRRTDGGVENPNHLLGAFPCLFPYGCGGLEVDRVQDVPYGTHVRWCLQYEDGRFRQDLHFVFQVFGAHQKREAAASSCLQIRRSTFIANEAAFHRLRPEDFIKASKEEASRQPISNPVIRSLRKQLTAVRARVMGTDESRIGFIRQNIRAHIEGTDAQTLLALPVERNITYSRPEDPRGANYKQRAAAAESRIARAVQPHDCKPFTCLKLKKGRVVCKRRAPWKTATTDWVTDTGDWGPKRLVGSINAWNPPLLQVTRCNQDMKLVTNGAETKDITFYITLYIAKRQIQAANASALLAKGTAFQQKYQQANIDSARRNKHLLQRCTNTLSRQHEFSAPEVISYLMGWGDRFISHTYVKIYWDQITAQLRRTFPNLVVSEGMQGLESTMTTAPPADEQDTIGVLTQNEDGVFILKDQLREYQDRGAELEALNLYDYFRQTYDGKMILRPDVPAAHQTDSQHRANACLIAMALARRVVVLSEAGNKK